MLAVWVYLEGASGRVLLGRRFWVSVTWERVRCVGVCGGVIIRVLPVGMLSVWMLPVCGILVLA